MFQLNLNYNSTVMLKNYDELNKHNIYIKDSIEYFGIRRRINRRQCSGSTEYRYLAMGYTISLVVIEPKR